MDQNTAIRSAIDTFDISLARKLVGEALRDHPDGETYYLASLVALNPQQKMEFLQKASALDPFHPEVAQALSAAQAAPVPPTAPVLSHPSPRTDGPFNEDRHTSSTAAHALAPAAQNASRGAVRRPIALVLLLLGLLVAFGSWFFLRSPTESAESAEQPLHVLPLGAIYGPLAVSPDGSMFGVSGTTAISLYDAKTLEQRHVFSTSGQAYSTMFAPDGTTFASASRKGNDEFYTIQVWSVSDEKLLRTFTVPTDLLAEVAFAPDGTTLASIAKDGVVQVWSLRDGQHLHTLDTPAFGLRRVAFAPDGTTLAATLADGIGLWRVSDGQLVRTVNTGAVQGMVFAPDGVTLVSIGYGTTVQVWNVGDGRLLHTLDAALGRKNPGVNTPVRVAFAPDGATLATVSSDGSVQVWSLDEGRTLHTLEIPRGEASEVRFAPDGTTLASVPAAASADTTIRLWRVSDGQLLRTFATSPVRDVAYILNGTTLASKSNDGTIRLWLINQ